MTFVQECLCAIPQICSTLLLLWSYYQYNFVLCLKIVKNVYQKIFYVLLNNFIFILLFWCLLVCMCKSNRVVPNEYRILNTEHNDFMNFDEDDRNKLLKNIMGKKNLIIYTCTPNGCIRYCIKCRHIKPDRAHHCSRCRICVLKMDHHCPWINNCICFTNYKAFLLLIFYITIYSLVFILSTLQYCIIFYKKNDISEFSIVTGFIIAAVFLVVFLVLLTYHIELVVKNQTTIESMREVVFYYEWNSFNLGCKENFCQVFGDDVLYWFVPVFSSKGNGYIFPVDTIA